MGEEAGTKSSGGGRRVWRPSANLGARLVLGVVAVMLLGPGLAVPAGAALPPVSVSQVKDIDPGTDPSFPMSGRNQETAFGGVNLGGTLIFDADVFPEHGVELWRSDGTGAGTTLIKDINPGGPPFSSSPSWFVEMNGEVFFNAAKDSIEGYELWKTDGTEGGTVLVKDINPAVVKSGSPANLVNVDGTLFFEANSDDDGSAELWKSDGTTGGTVLVRDIEASMVSGTPSFNFVAAGDRLFFTLKTAAQGKELWTSDGTFAGTKIVKDINPGAADGLPGPTINLVSSDLTVYDGDIFFRADDGVNGRELWRSDGTALGTTMVKDIAVFPGDGSMTGGASFAQMGGKLYFSTDFGFYETDGTGPGTVQVVGGFSPTETTNVDGTLYMVRNAYQLYKSDGTALGTEEVVDFGSGPVPDGPLEDLTDFNGILYFGFDDGNTFGKELWRSDGTAVGTERLTDINSGTGDSNILSMTIVGDRLYFRGDDGGAVSGNELWAAHSDVDPPETTIDSGPGGGETIYTDTATFAFSSDEAGSTFSCVLDSGPPEACDSGSKTYTGLSEGLHSFSVAATDPAPFSNVDPTPATRSFTSAVPLPPDTAAPKLRLRGAKKQKRPRRLVVKATCVDEACSLRATGRIKVKVLRPNGRVLRTKSLKLKKAAATGAPGKRVKLKLKLNRKSKRLVRKSFRRRASQAVITVRATDASGNTSSGKRKVKLVRK